VQDYIEPLDPNAKFNKEHYYKNPQLYRSVFHEKVSNFFFFLNKFCNIFLQIAPYMSVMVNCAYWDQKYPRMLTAEQMRVLNRQKRHR
jgi:alpha-aminoadipic semialdehyde synthase